MRDDGSHDDDILSSAVLRPISWGTLKRLSWAPGILYLLDGIAGLAAIFLFSGRVAHPLLTLVALLVCIVIGIAILTLVAARVDVLRRFVDWFVLAAVVGAGLFVALSAFGFGPSVPLVLAYFPQAAIYASMLLRRVWALGVLVLIGVEAALLVALQPGWQAPFAWWLSVMGGAVGLAVTAGALTARVFAAAEAEQAARRELAELNETLQQRVEEQVAQLEQAGQLRRFLSPQVADAVLAGDRDDVLGAHRRKIAVFFCDLRGFTAFTSRVEPEDVMDVLEQYYRTVGEVLREYEATVGSFAGDGIFAFLNDPAPCDDPAAASVAMAVEIRARLRPCVTRWRELGYDLGVGMGVTVGHATIGLVGYEGRQDYTALGTVVNLAARLCGAARDGQILVDLRTATELPGDVDTEHVEGLTLKGFPPEMRVLTVSGDI